MRKLKITIEDINRILLDRNIKCLSENYENASSNMNWGCIRCGYEWSATYNNIVKRGRGCSVCSKKKKYTTEQVINFGRLKGVLFLDENYKSDRYIHNWKCLNCGSIRKTSLTCINNTKYSCLKCSIESYKGEKHYLWMGGINKGYNKQFNDKLKQEIRFRDNYKCARCGKLEKDNDRKLHIHHIDSNKINCERSNLVSLCTSCHRIVGNDGDEKWKSYFITYIEELEIYDNEK